MSNQHLEVEPGALGASGNVMAALAEWLGNMAQSVEDAHLPFRALGLAGELGRSKYEGSRQTELTNIKNAQRKAQALAENLTRSGRGYATVEDTNNKDLQQLLYDLGWAPGSDGKFKAPSDPSVARPKDPRWPISGGVTNRSLASQEHILGTTTAATVGTTVVAGLTKQQLAEAAWRSTWQHPDLWPAAKLSRLATMTQATQKVLAVAGRLSIAATLAMAAWETIVVPDDYVIDDAVNSWSNVAYGAREVFGADAEAVHRDLERVWSGSAMGFADAGLRDFITAGVELADRAERRAIGLHDTIAQLDQIVDLAFKVAVASLVAIVAFALMPYARIATEAAGARLSTAVLVAVAAIDVALVAWAAVSTDTNKDLGGGSPSKKFPQRTFDT
jgi:hypothetical protein